MQYIIVSNIGEITTLQRHIMEYVDLWVTENHSLITKRNIIAKMKEQGVKVCTTESALLGLLKRGYLRRSCIRTQKTSYVQLRRV